MANISAEEYRRHIDGLSWNDLRKEAKDSGIPAKGTVKIVFY